jgi:hypothetical protein
MLFRGIFLLNYTVSNELKVRDCCEVRVILFGGHCVRTKGEREKEISLDGFKRQHGLNAGGP